jgi:hypothetical protein
LSSVAGRSAPKSRDALPIPGMELKTADAKALCRKSLRSIKLVTYQDACLSTALEILPCARRSGAHSRLQRILQGKGNPLWGNGAAIARDAGYLLIFETAFLLMGVILRSPALADKQSTR